MGQEIKGCLFSTRCNAGDVCGIVLTVHIAGAIVMRLYIQPSICSVDFVCPVQSSDIAQGHKAAI